MTTPSECRDDLYTLVVTAWGDRGPIDYEDKPRAPDEEEQIPPKGATPWLRLQVRHTDGRQATLANDAGCRRFRRYGLYTIQVFSPLGSSLLDPEELSILVVDALEGVRTPHCVFLRNVRMNEIGSDGHWFQVNVMADFEYDVIK
jgi:hypothetical protein